MIFSLRIPFTQYDLYSDILQAVPSKPLLATTANVVSRS